ncbi:hypothetical protein ZIOFF_044698 [Zingiber officinale]|uniref:Uncharacterized protein n=1 Tax=Zingiber officinale TaxID=94328 RepID=A0A8J5L0G5_ZINOF|nr:hypothetical protein ZIOFF_044698 [Zingiber officinale]
MHSQAFAPPISSLFALPKPCKRPILLFPKRNRSFRQPRSTALCARWRSLAISAALSPLDLTEENIRQVLVDARSEASIYPPNAAWILIALLRKVGCFGNFCKLPVLGYAGGDMRYREEDHSGRSEVNKAMAEVIFGQLFDASVGITGEVDLAELDGPFVKIRLKGRFWHKRSTVLDRISNYLKNRIPEILEVDIEDEKQLDDSPENF